MATSTVSIEISANSVAWYGAIIATISLGLNIYKIWKDRPHLKITIRKDYEIVGFDDSNKEVNLEPRKSFWLLSIANVSKYKLTIDQIGVEWKDKKGGAIVVKDYNGPIQTFALAPYTSRQFIFSEELLPLNKIKNVWIKDATGKIWRNKLINQ
jgi:hypothetical protein